MNSIVEFSSKLSTIPNVIHGFLALPINCSLFVDDKVSQVIKNRELLMSFLKLQKSQLIVSSIAHSNIVSFIDTESSIREIKKLNQDALITHCYDVALAVTYADCIPLLVSSADGEIVSAIHAGWRGLCSGIILNTVDEIKKYKKLNEIIVAIGPCISQNLFEVDFDVAHNFFDKWPDAVIKKGNKYHVDLTMVAFAQLLSSGITNIEKIGGYTDLESKKYFSHRRDLGKAGRNLAIIAKKNL